MTRLPAIDPAQAAPQVKRLMDQVRLQLGMVPNIVRTMAVSPAALEGYLALGAALGHGVLSPRLREQIALVVAEQNACGYCLSAHTALGKKLGLSEAELTASRRAQSSSAHDQAALVLARQIVESRGAISDGDLRRARDAGLGDAEIAEVVGHVAINVFTNYFNQLADTEIDFPKVEPLAVGAHG